MKTRKLNDEITVSSVCLGCMGFGISNAWHGWTVDYETTKSIIDAAYKAGINFFDTAPVYCSGTSEQFIGQAFRDLHIPREEIVIADKFYPRSPKEVADGISIKEHISTWLDRSLEKLGMEYIDLYILHMWDWHTDSLEMLQALQDEIDAGRIRAIGLANVYAWQAAKINALARQHGLTPFITVQNHWNLLAREDEREMVPFASEEGITLTPYSALAAGRLSKKPGVMTTRMEKDAYAAKKYGTSPEADARVINALVEVSEETGATMTETALAWLMEKGAVPIAGATRTSQVESLARACEVKLTEAQMKKLEEFYIPHVLTGVLMEHDAWHNPYKAYLGQDDGIEYPA